MMRRTENDLLHQHEHILNRPENMDHPVSIRYYATLLRNHENYQEVIEKLTDQLIKTNDAYACELFMREHPSVALKCAHKIAQSEDLSVLYSTILYLKKILGSENVTDKLINRFISIAEFQIDSAYHYIYLFIRDIQLNNKTTKKLLKLLHDKDRKYLEHLLYADHAAIRNQSKLAS